MTRTERIGRTSRKSDALDMTETGVYFFGGLVPQSSFVHVAFG